MEAAVAIDGVTIGVTIEGSFAVGVEKEGFAVAVKADVFCSFGGEMSPISELAVC